MERGKKGQQEMIGFALIVIVVVVGLMVYLGLTIGKDSGEVQEGKLNDFLSSLQKHTTECVNGGYLTDVEDLAIDCYQQRNCDNLGVSSCDYMSELLEGLVGASMATESGYSGYSFNITVTDREGRSGLANLYGEQSGTCEGRRESARERFFSGDEAYNFIIEVCSRAQVPN